MIFELEKLREKKSEYEQSKLSTYHNIQRLEEVKLSMMPKKSELDCWMKKWSEKNPSCLL